MLYGHFVLFDARKEDRCPHLVFPFPHPDSSPPRNYFLLRLCGKVCETAFRVSSVRVPVTPHGRSAFRRISRIYLESPEFIGVQGLLRVKKKNRALLRIPVMRVLRISNMYPARAPSILPSPVRPGRRRIRHGSWHLGTRGSPGAAPGRGRRASMEQHGCSFSFHAPYYSPYGLDPSVSHGDGPGLLVFSTMIRGHLYLLMVRFDLRFPASSPAPPPHSPRSEYRSDSLTPSCRGRRVPKV